MALAKTAQFFREVRQEVGKVTWPTRKETAVSTVMVFVMVIAMGLFFLIVDQVIQLSLKFILGMGV